MRANHTPARGINPEGWGVIITLLYGRAELIYTTYKYYNIPILSLTLIKLNMISRYRQKSRQEGEVLSGSRSLALEGQTS